MTEEEWLNQVEQYTPRKMLWALEKQFETWAGETNRSRKLKLFGCAACRRVSKYYGGSALRLIEVIELFVDGQASESELQAAHESVRSNSLPVPSQEAERSSIHASLEYADSALFTLIDPQYVAFVDSFVDAIFGATVNDPDDPEEENVHQKSLLLDIFGNPFRPITFNPDWRTSDVVAMARGMYETRDFAAMPILADALQDAGCEHADVLDHCRGPGPHVRGCWVVDHILEKA